MPKSITATGRQALRRAAAPAQAQFNPNEWHTIEEAAALVKVSPRRMRRWVYDGKVGSTVLPGGRGRRVSGAHLNDAMADHAE